MWTQDSGFRLWSRTSFFWRWLYQRSYNSCAFLRNTGSNYQGRYIYCLFVVVGVNVLQVDILSYLYPTYRGIMYQWQHVKHTLLSDRNVSGVIYILYLFPDTEGFMYQSWSIYLSPWYRGWKYQLWYYWGSWGPDSRPPPPLQTLLPWQPLMQLFLAWKALLQKNSS